MTPPAERAGGADPGGTLAAIRTAALGLFAERGYAGASMRDLARAVGIQPASLYHHFSGKEELLWDLTRSALDQLEEARRAAVAAVADEGPVERLSAVVRAHVAFHARSSLQARLVNLNLDYLRPDRAAQAQAARDAYEDRLTGLLVEGHRAGVMDVPEPRVTTFALLQMCTGVATWFRPDGALSVEELCLVYDRMARRIVAGTERRVMQTSGDS